VALSADRAGVPTMRSTSARSSIQIFYGAALVAAITVPKATRERIFKRRRTA
jgi:hypothetical protein